MSKQPGHASIQLMADLYGHLFKETSVSAMNKLADAHPGAKQGTNVLLIATAPKADRP